MRVAPAALLATSLQEALALSDHVTRVTHDHPEGLKGAAATAAAIWLARQEAAPEDIRREIKTRFGYDLSMTVKGIRPTYRHDESCQRSVPQALVCALAATGFEDAIRNAISIGGDSDTLAAIAGSIAETRFGMPDDVTRGVGAAALGDARGVQGAVRAARPAQRRGGVSEARHQAVILAP